MQKHKLLNAEKQWENELYCFSLTQSFEHIEDAYNWYEDQKTGLGNDFLNAIEAAIKRIEQTPNYYYSETATYRRMVIKKFPYKLVYEIEKDKVFVIAVKHFSQDLDY